MTSGIQPDSDVIGTQASIAAWVMQLGAEQIRGNDVAKLLLLAIKGRVMRLSHENPGEEYPALAAASTYYEIWDGVDTGNVDALSAAVTKTIAISSADRAYITAHVL